MSCSTLRKLPSCGCLTSSLTRLLSVYILRHLVDVLHTHHHCRHSFLKDGYSSFDQSFNFLLPRQLRSVSIFGCSGNPDPCPQIHCGRCLRQALPGWHHQVGQNSIMLTELLQQNPTSSATSLFRRYSARKNYDLYCGMDFRMFPMDTQARIFAFQ